MRRGALQPEKKRKQRELRGDAVRRLVVLLGGERLFGYISKKIKWWCAGVRAVRRSALSIRQGRVMLVLGRGLIRFLLSEMRA